MILYEACLDPGGNFTLPLYKVFPLNQFLIFLCIVTNVSCNIFLSFYLTEKSENNIAVREVDRKKDRKRNLVPAKTGLLVFVFYIMSMLVFMTTYAYKSEKLDSATRAFINSVYADFHHCVSSPLVILLGSTDAKKKLSHILNSGLQIVKRPFQAKNNWGVIIFTEIYWLSNLISTKSSTYLGFDMTNDFTPFSDLADPLKNALKFNFSCLLRWYECQYMNKCKNF